MRTVKPFAVAAMGGPRMSITVPGPNAQYAVTAPGSALLARFGGESPICHAALVPYTQVFPLTQSRRAHASR